MMCHYRNQLTLNKELKVGYLNFTHQTMEHITIQYSFSTLLYTKIIMN